MDDEDEEENFPDIAEIRETVTTDLLVAKKNNEKTVEETKAQISNLINNIATLNCCSTTNDDQVDTMDISEQDEIEIPDSIWQENTGRKSKEIDIIVKKSISAFQEKAIIDLQVVRLMEKEEIHDASTEMQEFYNKTKHFAENFGKDILKKHSKTAKKIEDNKVQFGKNIVALAGGTSFGTESENLDSFITKLVEKSAADFEKGIQKSQEMTQVTRADLENYLSGVFPPSNVTVEELQSKEFLEKDFSNITNKIIQDFNEHEVNTRQSIKETKKRLAQYPEEIMNGVKNLPHTLTKIRDIGLNIRKTPTTIIDEEPITDSTNEKNEENGTDQEETDNT